MPVDSRGNDIIAREEPSAQRPSRSNDVRRLSAFCSSVCGRINADATNKTIGSPQETQKTLESPIRDERCHMLERPRKLQQRIEKAPGTRRRAPSPP